METRPALFPRAADSHSSLLRAVQKPGRLSGPGNLCVRVSIVLLAVASFGFKDQTAHAESGDSQRSSKASASRSAGLDPGTSPEELLQALREARPPNDVIPSAGAAQRALENEGPLWPEGWSLVGLSGRMMLEDEQWLFEFVDPETNRPVKLKLLPNAALEIIARTVTADAGQRLTVFGTVTVYKKENYLLIKSVSRGSPPPPEPRQDRPPVLPADASAEEVAEAMKKQAPANELVSGAPVAPRLERTSISAAPVIPEGSPIINRSGRLVRSGPWWTFVTDSESSDQADPPFKVLPSRTLEMMADLTERDPTGLVFVVSGELTVFQGENYFLPKGAHRRIDTGNLSK